VVPAEEAVVRIALIFSCTNSVTEARSSIPIEMLR
jgi:hypothetical protein